MIYTSNKKYPFYMSHSYGLPEACSMLWKAQKQHVMTRIKEISIDLHLLPRTSVYLFTFLVTC
jgi:hypothetical protein